MSTSSSFVKTHALEGVTCICGDIECRGLTAAFKVLKDDLKRHRFVKFPSEQHSQRRESFLRYILPKQPLSSPNYIAVHHFHPYFLNPHHHKIPTTITSGGAVKLRMVLDHRDKVTDESGMPAFVFVPNYTKEQAKQDLKQLARDFEMKKMGVEDSASESSSVEIPTLVVVDDDEQSDVSSIHHENDEDRLVTLASAIIAPVMP